MTAPKKGQPRGYHATVAHIAKWFPAPIPGVGAPGLSAREAVVDLTCFIYGKTPEQVAADLKRAKI